MTETFVCPVCGYDGLYEPAWDNDAPSDEICPSCGTHFGFDDAAGGEADRRAIRHRELRDHWRASDCPWFSQNRLPPHEWNPCVQLAVVEE